MLSFSFFVFVIYLNPKHGICIPWELQHRPVSRACPRHRFLTALELEAALQDENKTIIPVLIRGGRVPPAEALPATLSAFTKLQSIELRRDYWDHDIKLLTAQFDKKSTEFNPILEDEAESCPVVVTSKIVDAEYMITVGCDGRRIYV